MAGASRQVRPPAPARRRLRPLRRRAARAWPGSAPRCSATTRSPTPPSCPSASHARAEEDIRAATTGKHGLLSRSIELDADALVVRATVLTYQWIDELRDAAYESLGAIAGRAIGYLAPNVALGGAIVSAGLIETDALDRDGVAAYLNELAAANPELMDHVISGGGGLLDGLQMRSALTAGFVSGEPGRQAARGGCVPSASTRCARTPRPRSATWPAGLLAGPRAAIEAAPAVEAPQVPASLVDLMATAGGAREPGARAPHRARPLRRLRRPPARRRRARRRPGAAAGLRRPHAVRRRGGADDRGRRRRRRRRARDGWSAPVPAAWWPPSSPP